MCCTFIKTHIFNNLIVKYVYCNNISNALSIDNHLSSFRINEIEDLECKLYSLESHLNVNCKNSHLSLLAYFS